MILVLCLLSDDALYLNKVSWPGLEKLLVLPVLDRFLKLKSDLFPDKKLKNRSIKFYTLKNLQYTAWHYHLSKLFTPNNPL